MRRDEGIAVVRRFPDCHNPTPCRTFLKELHSHLSDKYQPKMIFDLSGVQTMNALGIDLLLQCVVLVSECDGELRLACASPQTSLVLELTQLNQVVEVFPTVAEAVAHLNGQFLSHTSHKSANPAA